MNWKNNPRPSFQNPNFESMNELRIAFPNLSFTVKNKMGNSDKKR